MESRIVAAETQVLPFELDDEHDPDGRLARPVQIAFCTSWRMTEDDVLEIVDPFDEIETDALPLVVDGERTIYCAVFWEGYAIDVRADLVVHTPAEHVLAVRLPPLKPFYWEQVQMNSLLGFSFQTLGDYRFKVATESIVAERSLRIRAIQSPGFFLADIDEAEMNGPREADTITHP